MVENFNDIDCDLFYEKVKISIFFVGKQGAQMIELDVQLSHEKVPIIYHDFSVKTSVIDVTRFF